MTSGRVLWHYSAEACSKPKIFCYFFHHFFFNINTTLICTTPGLLTRSAEIDMAALKWSAGGNKNLSIIVLFVSNRPVGYQKKFWFHLVSFSFSIPKNTHVPVYRFVEHKRTAVRFSCVVTYLRIYFCLQVEGSGRQNTAPIVAIANIVIQVKRFPGISIQSIDRKQTRSI